MSDLTGQLISNTYKQVILVSSSTSNTGVNTSLKAVQTGDGTNTALKVATNAVQITGALGVTGNVSLDANLHVDDKVCASAFYGDGSNLSGVTASVGGNISVSNATVGGNLYVGGTATVAGAAHLQSTVSVGGAAQFGSTVTVSGATQLQSTVTAVGAATFKSTVTVENAAILKNNVSVGGTFAVAGAATFTSKTEFDNDVSVSGRLDVASSVCVGGIAKFASDVSVSGNLNVVNNVTAAFFYGDGSNLTNVEAELGIATNISVSGFIHAGGSVSVSGPFNVVGAATFKSNVSVSGNSNFTGTVTVGGAVSLASSLSVGGAANFASTVTVAGAVSLASTLSVGGATNLGSTVTVVGAGTFKDAVSVSGNLNIGGTVTVGGAVSLASSLSVGGAANFASTVTVAGAVSLASTLSVGGAANFASTVTIAGTNIQATNARVCASAYYGDGSNLTNVGISGNISVNNATVGGNLYVGGTVTAVGAAIFNSTVTVSGNATFKTNVSVSGNTNLGGTVTVAGAASLASTLSVGGAANFASTVTIAGAASVGGTFNVGGAFTSPGIDDNASSTAITIDSSQNVGIKTAVPGGDLHVQGDAGNQVRLYLTDGDATGVGNSLLIAKSGTTSFISDRQTGSSLWFGTADTERMRIDSSGNVGIGTNNPSRLLEVNEASGDAFMRFRASDTGGGADTVFENLCADNGQNNYIYFGDLDDTNIGIIRYSHASDFMSFTTNASERMRIDSSGNVGIGTSNPGQELTVSGNMQLVGSYTDFSDYWGSGSNSAFFLPYGFVGSNGGFKLSLYANGYRNSSSSFTYMDINGNTNTAAGIDLNVTGEISFSTGTASGTALPVRMTIDSSGNVGIGTTSPDYQLDVSGTTDPRIILQSTGTASTDDTIFMNRIGGTSATNQIWFGDSGSAATGKLQYDHSNNAMTFHTNGGSERMRIDSAGHVAVGTTTTGNTSFTIATNSSGVTPNTTGDDLFIESSGNTGMTIGSGTASQGRIYFADSGNAIAGRVGYDHTNDSMYFGTNGVNNRMTLDSTGQLGIGTASPAKQLHITKAAKADIGTLTDGATITPDFDANQNFSVTLGGNRTLANPSNIDAGQTGSIFVVQDGTGSRTLSFGSYWKFAGGTAPTLSTAGGSVDRIDYIVYTATAIHAVATLNVS